MVSHEEYAGGQWSYEVGPEFHGKIDELQSRSVRLLARVKGMGYSQCFSLYHGLEFNEEEI